MNKTATLLFLCTALFAQQNVLMLHINEGKPDSAFCLECSPKIEPECAPVDFVKMGGIRYECVFGKTVREKIILKNTKIELEKAITNSDEYILENIRPRRVLENKMNSNFLKDFNKMKLATKHKFSVPCYNVNIYDNDTLIVTFETNGLYFYDRKNKLIYEVDRKGKVFNPEEHDLLRKYWDIFEENRCR